MLKRTSKRLHLEKEERDCQGKFTKTCGSIIHLSEEFKYSILVDLQTKKRINARDYRVLIDRGIVSRETKYACKSCIASVLDKNNLEIHSRETSYMEEQVEEDESVLRYIEVGQEINAIIKPDICQMYNSGKLKTIKSLIQHKPVEWLADRPPELV